MADQPYPYVARGKRFGDLEFDFLIADDTGAYWYDSTGPDMRMPERVRCWRYVRPGDVILDCGAHHGMFAVLFGKWTGPKGKVISYEALPSNAEVVRQNVGLNGLTNVEVRGVGVSDEAKRLKARLNEGNVVVVDHGVANPEDQVADVELELVRLDDDLPKRFQPDLIKIDVEGSDLQALKGMERLLKARPIVDFELHNFLFDDPVATLKQIFAMLPPEHYRYEILPEILSVGWALIDDGLPDLEWLATFENPHVFFVPRQRPLATSAWLRRLRTPVGRIRRRLVSRTRR